MSERASAAFWRVFGAAVACYVTILIVRGVRAGRSGLGVLSAVIALCLFISWASRFPRAASETFGVLAVIAVALNIIIPSTEPLALHLSFMLLIVVIAYLAFRAHRIAAYQQGDSRPSDGDTLDSDDPPRDA